MDYSRFRDLKHSPFREQRNLHPVKPAEIKITLPLIS